ncbi:hypothetical protein ACA910_004214 [Epithemia clementina (nom. ined.)]
MIAAVLPYWFSQTFLINKRSSSFFSDKQKQQDECRTSVEQRTTSDNDGVCEAQESNAEAAGDSCTTISSSSTVATDNLSRSKGNCCTVIQLLFTVWQPPESNYSDSLPPKTTLKQLKTVTTGLSNELGLDLLDDSLQCSSSSGPSFDDNKTVKPRIGRCLGLLSGRGFLSVYKINQPKPERDASTRILVNKSPLYVVDFYLPSSPHDDESPSSSTTTSTTQEMVDRLSHYFESLSNGGDKVVVAPRRSPQPPLWHHAERGFRYTTTNSKEGENHADEDAFMELDIPWVVDMPNLRMQQNRFYKRHMVHLETKFQQLDLYEVLDLRFHAAATTRSSGDNSVDSDGPLLPYPEEPDLVIFFDSIMQSRKRGLEAYHEALVHPLLFAHPNPRRVAIFGGGEGATLREVLKHKTIHECVMIEIDEQIVQAANVFLQDWNDCSDLLYPYDHSSDNNGTAGQTCYQSCFDDPRATLYFEDAIGWFIRNYFTNENVKEEDKFDVIILDSLDPGSMLEFSDYMYGNMDFANALRAALREGGILGGQVGIEKQRHLEDDHDWIKMIQNLDQAGFLSLKDYNEAGCGFDDAWKFFIAPTDRHGQLRWFASEAQADLDIARRSALTKSGESAMKFMDGATMASYQTPSRKTENLYCKYLAESNVNDRCSYRIDSDTVNVPSSAFEIRPADNAGAGQGVFSVEDIPAKAYLALDERVHGMLVMPKTLQLIDTMDEASGYLNRIHLFVHGYGTEIFPYGGGALIVDTGIFTFANHGCNGAYQTSRQLPITEVDAEVDRLPKTLDTRFYNPGKHRQNWVEQIVQEVDRPLPSGTQLFENHLFHYAGASLAEWNDAVERLRAICQGEK